MVDFQEQIEAPGSQEIAHPGLQLRPFGPQGSRDEKVRHEERGCSGDRRGLPGPLQALGPQFTREVDQDPGAIAFPANLPAAVPEGDQGLEGPFESAVRGAAPLPESAHDSAGVSVVFGHGAFREGTVRMGNSRPV